ncbi:MAG: hypothetical protein ACK5HP_00135 [Bacilli bacterium]
MFNIIKQESLLNCCNNYYLGALFKCNNYLFFKTNEKILEFFNCNFKKIVSKKLCDSYITITVGEENCFYALKQDDYDYIYILNDKFIEVDRIFLNVSRNFKKIIKSISYNKNKIYILTSDLLYSVTTNGDFIKVELNQSNLENFNNKSETIYFKNLNGCCIEKNKKSKIIFSSVGFFCDKLYVSYIINNSSYVSLISKNGNIINKIYIDDNIEVNSILTVNENLEFLVTKVGKYNYLYITDYCCSKIKKIDNCNICLEPCKKDKCHVCDCKQQYCDLLESIALEEAAISHILNAEGEKIQKAVCLSNNICDLLKINESVTKTISNVNILEQILLEKLNSLKIDFKNMCK